jgi:hypothetical protein
MMHLTLKHLLNVDKATVSNQVTTPAGVKSAVVEVENMHQIHKDVLTYVTAKTNVSLMSIVLQAKNVI